MPAPVSSGKNRRDLTMTDAVLKRPALLDVVPHDAVASINKIIKGVGAVISALVPDGKIGDFKQGATGDCFVLSALNATAQTAEGRRTINESITYAKGSYAIQFKGDPTHTVYNVTGQEISEAASSGKISTGDADVQAFELAVSHYMQSRGGDIQGGNSGAMLELLTGKKVESTEATSRAENETIIHEAASKPGGFTLVLGSGVVRSPGPMHGQPVSRDDPLSGPGRHAFTVTSIDEKSRTVILENPWDTSQPYRISIDKLASMGRLFYIP